MTIFSVIYFYSISKDWVWFEVFGVGLNAVVVVLILFLPESPKFLYAQKRWSELRESLNLIARVNGKPPVEGRFEHEPIGMN